MCLVLISSGPTLLEPQRSCTRETLQKSLEATTSLHTLKVPLTSAGGK